MYCVYCWLIGLHWQGIQVVSEILALLTSKLKNLTRFRGQSFNPSSLPFVVCWLSLSISSKTARPLIHKISHRLQDLKMSSIQTSLDHLRMHLPQGTAYSQKETKKLFIIHYSCNFNNLQPFSAFYTKKNLIGQKNQVGFSTL